MLVSSLIIIHLKIMYAFFLIAFRLFAFSSFTIVCQSAAFFLPSFSPSLPSFLLLFFFFKFYHLCYEELQGSLSLHVDIFHHGKFSAIIFWNTTSASFLTSPLRIQITYTYPLYSFPYLKFSFISFSLHIFYKNAFRLTISLFFNV